MKKDRSILNILLNSAMIYTINLYSVYLGEQMSKAFYIKLLFILSHVFLPCVVHFKFIQGHKYPGCPRVNKSGFLSPTHPLSLIFSVLNKCQNSIRK